MTISSTGAHPAPAGGTERGQDVSTDGAFDCGAADVVLANGRAVIHFDAIDVLVVRTRRGIFAVEDRCPHMGRRLSDASISRRTLTCREHGLRYDLPSGRPAGRAPVRRRALRTFDVVIEAGRLWLSPRAPKRVERPSVDESSTSAVRRRR